MKLKKGDALLVPVIIASGKVLSLVFNTLLGSYYGAGKISDAFIMAHTIPTILFDGVATAFISCYIPIYSSLKYDNPSEIDRFNSNMTSISFLSSLLITIIYLFFMKQINAFYGNGFDVTSMNLLNRYTTITSWSIPFIGAYAIFRANLQVKGKKAISSVGQVVCYLVLIIAVVSCYPSDMSMAWATLLGNVVCFGIFLVASLKVGFSYKPYLSLKEPYIKVLLVMLFPILFSTLASEIASIIDKYFASQHSEGIITSLTYGYQLSFSIQGIVSLSLLIIIFPTLADKAAKNDESGMNSVFYTSIDVVCWIVLPLVVGGILVSEPIVKILFGHGNFSDESVHITARIFSVYLIGVLPMCIKHIGDRLCFAMKKTNYAMITTVITVVANIILDYIMNILWGYEGLAAATGLSIIIGLIATIIIIQRDDKSLSWRRILSSFGAPAVCVIAMAFAILFMGKMFDNASANNIMSIIFSIIVGIIAYMGTAFIIFKKQLRKLLAIAKNRGI